ncbi:MAG: hypothetical protein WCA38_17650 [Candidatus Acidiferrales bacterium]
MKLLGLAAVLGLSGQIVSLDHVAPRSQINDLQVTSFAIIAEPGSAEQQTTIGPGPGPSDAVIEARSLKLLENQHRNDEGLEQYERVERHVDRTGGAAPKVLEDKTYRVVSTGTGTLKLLLKENDKPADPAEYHRQLLAWRDLLEIMLKPEDPKAKIAYAKSEKKKADRRELVDAARDAFLTKWAGQETRNGRVCDVFDLDPNPNFHPHSIIQDALTHVTAKIWVDREANQLSRGEAHVMRDISFGGGILGKLYRGGVFSLEQTEVAPGIWLPTRYQYDFMGRKFLFTFEEHQYIEVGQYHHDGSPKQALALVQNEIATGKSAYGDP